MEDPEQIKRDIYDRYSINVREDDLPRFKKYVEMLVDEKVKNVGKFREEYKKERKEIGKKVRENKISVDEAKRRIREARSRLLEEYLEGEGGIYSSKVEAAIAKRKEEEKRRKGEEKYEEGIKDKILGHGLPFFKEGVERKVKFGREFDKLPLHARKEAWTEWYRQEMENLRAAYQKGDIKEDEFRKHSNDLKKYVNKEMGFGPRWSWRTRRLEQSAYGGYLKSVIYLLAFIVIGVIVAGTTGSWLFFVGFLGIAIYLLFPDPHEIDAKEEEKKVSGAMFLSIVPGHSRSSSHNGIAFMKSAGKVTAIIGFAFGFQGLGDVFNTLFIATAIFGYFLLKVEYENSAEFIESLLRFFLGIILIPWIFNDIFNSLVLAGIAFAFFAIPPLPSEGIKDISKVLSRGLSGATAYFEMAQKFIFIIIMVLVLIGSGSLGFMGISPAAGWGLTGTMQYTFIYFWLVCGIAGFFSPAKERPVTGGIMLGAALVIYGIGPGSQAVGAGLLGQWWPTVHNTFSAVTEPMANIMSSLGNTLGQGFLLLTNPVGYATQLMNGTYAQNPVGQTGSFGVDITDFTITNIFPEQPYVISAIMENKGAFMAENVSISLLALGGDKFATTGTSRTRELQWTLNPYDVYGRKQKLIDIENLGFKTGLACNYLSEDRKECFQCYGEDISENLGNKPCVGKDLDRLMVWQAGFQSIGITCFTIAGTSLRKMFIPISAKVKYDYQSDSRVEVEFISKAEWDRLAQAGQLDNRFKFVQSQYSSAPVKFPIGTAGLKNPILENQQFHISMMLDSAFERGSQIEAVEGVELRYPTEWGEVKDCSPSNAEKQLGRIIWKEETGGPKTFVCYFNPLGPDKLGGAPSKTYIVTAHANYTFSRWKYKDTDIKFGGFCCPDDRWWCKEDQYCKSQDCLDGQYCLHNACVYKQAEDGGAKTDFERLNGYCDKRLTYPENNERGWKCLLGMGGCDGNDDCMPVTLLSNMLPHAWLDDQKASAILNPMECVPIRDGISACCYVGSKPDACKQAFEEWNRQTKAKPELLSAPYKYPDEKAIHAVYETYK